MMVESRVNLSIELARVDYVQLHEICMEGCNLTTNMMVAILKTGRFYSLETSGSVTKLIERVSFPAALSRSILHMQWYHWIKNDHVLKTTGLTNYRRNLEAGARLGLLNSEPLRWKLFYKDVDSTISAHTDDDVLVETNLADIVIECKPVSERVAIVRLKLQ
ncbi:unnamed protein product [Soboliphyme baturini]|uniref:YqaJ domain-containing protein n=1 Tax=Soboliphyme baturini TaxID=241478 RepID=A0A183IB96_9BILA|nr:unnamed protein product [Soboliphyme baturini]